MKKTIKIDELDKEDDDVSDSSHSTRTNLTLQQAIDFGEYDPKVLANFADWHELSPHIQWQLIRKALDIRHKQLVTQYAELNNVLFLSKKPEVKEAMVSVEKQIKDLSNDREDLYVEYSNKMV